MKAKFVNESLNEDLSFAPHDLVIAILGAISIWAIPWISKKIAQRKETKQIQAAKEAALDLAIKQRKILDLTLKQLKKDKHFVVLFKNMLNNPVEGKPDMFLKNRRYMRGKPLEKQPIRKDKIGDYQSMQKERQTTKDALQQYLVSTLSDEQKTVLESIMKNLDNA
jgi:hypothetical protein